jgi:hydrogenase maturation protein HypF
MRKTPRRIKIEASIKGAEFKQFVYRLASALGLSGYIREEEGRVVIEAEGSNLNKFLKRIIEAPPPPVVIERITKNFIPILGETFFRITGSDIVGTKFLPTAPMDVALCRNCLKEIINPNDRRYFYPFNNCPDCASSLSVLVDIPLTRTDTTYADFKPCKSCMQEFLDPLNRRFQHHTITCPECGPAFWLEAVKFVSSNPSRPPNNPPSFNVIQKTKSLLQEGVVFAIKRSGGFYLVCDALNSKAVDKVLSLNRGNYQNYFLLSNNIEEAKKHFLISEQESSLLRRPARPVVICRHQSLGEIGLKLPCSALDHLLSQGSAPLLLSSGNDSIGFMIKDSEEAVAKLSPFVNYFFFNDLALQTPVSETYIRNFEAKPIYIRRSQGSAPFTLEIPQHFPKNLLAVGGDINNTFCLARGNQITISHHIGMLSHYPTLRAFYKSVFHYYNLYKFTPEQIVCDWHPDYISGAWAERQRLSLLRVQHHHAHFASCLVENRHWNRALGVILDGGGYGEGGALWGGEFLMGGISQGFQRVGHLKEFQLPGGDLGTFEPWRIAVALLKSNYGEKWREFAPRKFVRSLNKKDLEVIETCIDRNFNCRVSSACGRFADAVAALVLDINTSDYLSQPAIQFISYWEKSRWAKTFSHFFHPPYEYAIVERDQTILDLDGLVRGVVRDLKSDLLPETISHRFHLSLTSAIAETALQIAQKNDLDTIALAGGYFLNLPILLGIKTLLQRQGYRVLIPQELPAGDGGLCLGQAILTLDIRQLEK